MDNNKIIEMYQSGLSSTKIGKIYGTSLQNIIYILKKNGIERRPNTWNSKKLTLNENYFEKINSDIKAYFLGLIYSDGCITKSRMLISLVEDDSYLLDKFSEELEYIGKIYSKKIRNIRHQPQRTLEITSRTLVNDLNKHGVFPKKSLTIKFPTTIPKELTWSFIRGLFDGDGSVYLANRKDGNRKYKEPGIQIITNIFLGETLKEFLISEGFDQITYSLVNNDNNVNVVIKRKDLIKRFYEKLYFDKNLFCLERKRDKFSDIFDYYDSRKFIYKDEKIYQFTKNNEFIKEWENLEDVCKFFPNIKRECVLKCFRNKIKTSGGFIWKLNNN